MNVHCWLIIHRTNLAIIYLCSFPILYKGTHSLKLCSSKASTHITTQYTSFVFSALTPGNNTVMGSLCNKDKITTNTLRNWKASPNRAIQAVNWKQGIRTLASNSNRVLHTLEVKPCIESPEFLSILNRTWIAGIPSAKVGRH